MNTSKKPKDQKFIAQTTSSGLTGLRNRELLFLFIILLLSFLAYMPVLNNGFVNWDETKYIQNNELIRSINLKDIFSKFQMGNYHPITMLVYAIEYHFWQANETGYHAINLIFHLLNVVLVFKVVQLFRGKSEIALLTALIFGIHPMHVESVAWAAELKDVLYSFFFLLSFCFYLVYKKSSSKLHYFLSIFLFLLSLLSKAMAVPLPLVLLLTDYFMERKINLKSFIEKLPYFLLAIVFGIVAVIAQKSTDAIQGFLEFSFFQHIVFASYGFINYLIKLLIPFHLSAFYPYPQSVNEVIPFQYYLYLPLLLLIFFLVYYSSRFNRIILFGVGLFTITIFPVLQIMPVGDAIMADRYSYISSIGIIFLFAEGIYLVWERKHKWIAASLIFAFTLFYTTQSFSRCSLWKDGITLWSDVIDQYPNVYVAYGNRGSTYSNESMYTEALSDFNNAIKLAPNYYLLYLNRGIVFNNQKKSAEAFDDFNRAINLNPNIAITYNYRGAIYLNQKSFENAISDFNNCIQLDTRFADAYYNRGIAYLNLKNPGEALDNFSRSIQLEPKNRAAYFNRAIIYQNQNKFEEALKDYDEAIELDPGYLQSYYNRGLVLIKVRKFEGAINDFSKFIEADSSNAMAYYSRGIAEYYLNMKVNACDDIFHAAEMGLQPAMALYNKFCK